MSAEIISEVITVAENVARMSQTQAICNHFMTDRVETAVTSYVSVSVYLLYFFLFLGLYIACYWFSSTELKDIHLSCPTTLPAPLHTFATL